MIMTRPLIRGLVTTAAAGVMLVTGTAGAWADDCANVSRAAPECGMTCTAGPIVQGRWVWLPSVGVPLAAWGFETPDRFTDGKADALTAQGDAASGGAVCATPNRQPDWTSPDPFSGMQGVLSSDACGLR
jgi:hypothetical protein